MLTDREFATLVLIVFGAAVIAVALLGRRSLRRWRDSYRQHVTDSIISHAEAACQREDALDEQIRHAAWLTREDQTQSLAWPPGIPRPSFPVTSYITEDCGCTERNGQPDRRCWDHADATEVIDYFRRNAPQWIDTWNAQQEGR